MFLLFAAKRVSNIFAATWTKSNCSLKPMLATTLSSLQERGKAALKHFTEGQVMHVDRACVWHDERVRQNFNAAQFSECASVFRSVLQQLLLVVADEPGDADTCKELLGQSRDYLTAVTALPHFSSPCHAAFYLSFAFRSSSRRRGGRQRRTGARALAAAKTFCNSCPAPSGRASLPPTSRTVPSSPRFEKNPNIQPESDAFLSTSSLR